MFKKVYLEITNNCNLNCDFCLKNNRNKKFMMKSELDIILNKLEGFTKYVYFHVMGEPLIHPLINEFIDMASKKYFVNITTNGYLIEKLKNNKNIRQINISLHSFNEKYNVSLNKYLDNIFDVIDNLSHSTYFSLRFWVDNPYNKEMIKYINDRYNIEVMLVNNFKIKENVFISINKEFIWPDLENDYYNEHGKCYALKDHLGILVNGDVVPCCLDANGVIKLGNIFENDLKNIMESERVKKMLNGFKNNYKCEELCRKCNFLE